MKQFNLTNEAMAVEALRKAWMREYEDLHRTIEECRISRSTPPPNYWQREYAARRRFQIAVSVLEVLET